MNTTQRMEIVIAAIVAIVSMAVSTALAACKDCGTSVGGTISGNVTWTQDGSPYCVTNDVYVAGNLIIREGVNVLFCSNYVFEVGGKIRVVGTDSAPVTFQPYLPSVGWQGLLFRDAVPGSYFVNTVIQGSKNSGLRITNTPPALTNCWIINNSAAGDGGGIKAEVLDGNQFVLSGCVISNNVAKGYGGGVRLEMKDGLFLAQDSIFINNTANGAGSGAGGGVSALVRNSKVRVVNCAAIGNSVTGAGGHAGGGGLAFQGRAAGDLTLEMIGTRIEGNSLLSRHTGGGQGDLWANGGGVGVQYCQGVLRNCWITGNSATQVSGGNTSGNNSHAIGGGVYVGDSNCRLENCVIATNSVSGWRYSWGSAVFHYESGYLDIVNSTLVGNQGDFAVDWTSYPTVRVTNSIVYFNNGNAGQLPSSSSITVGYSCVQGGFPGTGNIQQSPSLCSDNLSLRGGSPCIDAGNPALEYRDGCIDDREDCSPFARGTSRNDMGAYGGAGVCNWTDSSPEPQIRIQPEGGVVLEGDPAAMGVIATGETPLTNRWYKGTAMFPGEKGAALRFSHVQLSDSSIGTDQTNAYWVEVSNARGTVASEPVWLMVSELGVTASLEQGKVWLTIRRNKPVANCEIRVSETTLGPWTKVATVALPGSTTRWQVPDAPAGGPKFYFAVPAN